MRKIYVEDDGALKIARRYAPRFFRHLYDSMEKPAGKERIR